MPLIDLKTDLKSLKYGQDRPGGGNSDQPYITTDINNPTTTLSLVVRNQAVKNILIEANKLSSNLGIGSFDVNNVINQVGGFIDRSTKFDDGFIRGGVLGATNAALTDTIRIAKFLTDAPKGPLFIARQVGLQLSNPRLEVKKGVGAVISSIANLRPGGLLGTLTGGALEPTRIYNLGINTLAQIPLNAVGGHIVRHGVLPIPERGSDYESVVTFNNVGDNVTNTVNTTVDKLFGTNLAGNVGNKNRLYGLVNELQLETFAKPSLVTSFNTITKVINDASSDEGKEGSGQGAFTYLDKTTGKIYKSSELNFNDPKISKMYQNGQLVNNGVDPNSDKLEKETIVRTKKIKVNVFNSAIIGRTNTKEPSITLGLNIPSLSYILGPGSVYGIGYTGIKRYSITGYNYNKELFKDISRTTTQNLTRIEVNDSDNEKSAVIADLGLSLLDPNLVPFIEPNDPKYDENNRASIRDNTVVNYKSNIPSLRKYSELLQANQKKQVRKINPSFNLINTTELHNSNVDNQTLTKEGTVNKRNLSSINFNSEDLDSDITYNNGIQNSDNSPQTVTLKGWNNWNKVAREQRIGSFGEAQTRIITDITGSNKTFATKTVSRADSINLTPIFSGKKYFGNDEAKIKIKGGELTYNIRDLVKFRIQSVNTNNPDSGDWMIFRALLTQFSDNVDTQWTDINYVGRGNKFYVYNGFTRKIQVGFKVAALSAEEMQPMYSKLNHLIASLMPDYEANVMRGSLHRLTVGNYLDSQFGKIDSVSYTIPNDSPWEIALDEPEGGTRQLILPHVIEVQINFTPIGAETQGVNKIEAKNNSTSFIAQNSTGKDKDTIQYYSNFYNET